jgi:hypothetical protein
MSSGSPINLKPFSDKPYLVRVSVITLPTLGSVSFQMLKINTFVSLKGFYLQNK